MSFDVSAIPTQVDIDKATLRLFGAMRMGRSTATLNVGAYVVLRDWASCEATWDEAMTGVPWGKPGCDDPVSDRRPDPERRLDVRSDL